MNRGQLTLQLINPVDDLAEPVEHPMEFGLTASRRELLDEAAGFLSGVKYIWPALGGQDVS
ncbi:hypothetical protein AB0M48_18510 [Lentzea sp. NPDC051208]|uniref:hypothetical protein n=1 Tax=Lentzea sp. NPDC051208 TaxID=3154642 RepID=UPI00342DD4C0